MGKFKEFWEKYETKIVLILGLVLVAGVSFEAGYLRGKSRSESPIIFQTAQNCPQNDAGSPENTSTASNATSASQAPSGTGSVIPTDCMFVGSKNSNKYHLPTCGSAKRIKPENIVCFKSAEEAATQGYEPSKDCIK